MLRASHFPPTASSALGALRLSLVPIFNQSSPPFRHRFFASALLHRFLPSTLSHTSPYLHSLSLKRVPTVVGHPCTRGRASFCVGSSAGGGREILVQHLLVKEDDLKLLLELQKKTSEGVDLSDLAVEYSTCPSKGEGGMLGWVKKGQMVSEFEEAAFSAPLNKVVRCKTKFGWHLLQVLSEREESLLQDIQTTELHAKMQDHSFSKEAQLIDVREPEEVAQASLPGFHVLPLRQFGNWGPEVTNKFDPQKDTYVLCHHGVRSLQVAKWLQTQGFKRVFNVTGGIHAYATEADPSVPTY
ncbi:rhodanese-like/PpiC domain-containing protein 12, chloroplastic [Malania oleifera]|uniref:rhodanese-like/PpiC domain-containing protein 12, chloroplastic n=1 Tax=Malania oleifera TaxID=397392 RepID=UPI0025AEA359|nr:rhodanese-like/PpiC domain-containing protein 12, chloroplastic [Malania oleifera]